jgi:hypothetical protein
MIIIRCYHVVISSIQVRNHVKSFYSDEQLVIEAWLPRLGLGGGAVHHQSKGAIAILV